MAWAARILLGLAALAGLGLAGVLGWLAHGPEPAPQEPPAEQIAKAQEILKDPRWSAPAGWKWAEFQRPDGSVLRFGFAPASPQPGPAGGPAPTFVFVPGFTALI